MLGGSNRPETLFELSKLPLEAIGIPIGSFLQHGNGQNIIFSRKNVEALSFSC
jgi:hypothetical protein